MLGTRPNLLPQRVYELLAVVSVVAALLLVLAVIPPLFDAFRRARSLRLRAPASPALAIVALAATGYGIVVRAEPHAPRTNQPLHAERVWGPFGTQTWIIAEQRHPC